MDYGKVKRNALRNARKWAKLGNAWMAQNFLTQAQSIGYVSDRQVASLNRMLMTARQRRD